MNRLALALLVPALVGCGGTTGYKPTPVATPTHSVTHKPKVTKPRTTPTHKVTPTPNSKMYKDCKQAFAERHVPVYKWEPQYNPKLDGDHDGLACEHED